MFLNTHVCHIISGYQRNDPRILQRQCKSLLNYGYSVSILTNDGLAPEIIDEIPVYVTHRFWNNRLKILLFAKYQFLKSALLVNADIYQLHSPELISLGITLQRKGKKVVYDAHEDLPRHILEKEWIPPLFRRVISNLVDRYIRYYLKRYNAIISPHQHVVDDLLQINNNTILITNYAKINPSTQITKEAYLTRDNVICYSGTCYFHSNQLQTLEAISSIDITYNIAGFIPDLLYEQMKLQPSFDKLHFWGRIPWQELANFYSNSRIGIVVIDYKMNLGNKKGTFAVNKMFEYMEASLPIICSDYDLWILVIEKHKCGIYVQPGNVSQIRDAICFLIENPEIAYQMGQNGRNAVVSEYNWGIEEVKYSVLFEDML